MSVAESPPMIETTASCTEAGCDFVASGPTAKARLGVHRWNAHKIKGAGAGKKKPKARTGSSRAAPAGQRPPRPTGTPLPTGRGRRSAADILGTIWGGLGGFMPDPAAAQCMGLQEPYAGEVLDKAIAGTFVDRKVLQKFAGQKDKWEPVAELVGMPAMLVMVRRNPALASWYEVDGKPELVGPLAKPLKTCAQAMLLSSLKVRAREQADIKALLAEAARLDIKLGNDPIGELLRGLMLPPAMAPTQEPSGAPVA